MSIEKGIRAFSVRVSETLKDEAFVVDGNSDVGCLDTSYRQGKAPIFHFIKNALPERVTLQTRIVSLPWDKTSVMFQQSVNGTLSKPQDFYGKKVLYKVQKDFVQWGQFQAVELVYTGQGSFLMQGERLPLPCQRFASELVPGSCVLRKNFLCQTAPLLVQRQVHLGGHTWLVTPPYDREHQGGRLNSWPLIAYGGYAKPGLPLEHISQTFAVFDRKEPVTSFPKLKIFTQRTLERSGVSPPYPGVLEGHTYTYSDRFQKETLLNLAGLIQTGKSHVVIGEGEGEDYRQRAYRSYQYTQTDPASHLVDIHFKPVQEDASL